MRGNFGSNRAAPYHLGRCIMFNLFLKLKIFK